MSATDILRFNLPPESVRESLPLYCLLMSQIYSRDLSMFEISSSLSFENLGFSSFASRLGVWYSLSFYSCLLSSGWLLNMMTLYPPPWINPWSAQGPATIFVLESTESSSPELCFCSSGDSMVPVCSELDELPQPRDEYWICSPLRFS